MATDYHFSPPPPAWWAPPFHLFLSLSLSSSKLCSLLHTTTAGTEHYASFVFLSLSLSLSPFSFSLLLLRLRILSPLPRGLHQLYYTTTAPSWPRFVRRPVNRATEEVVAVVVLVVFLEAVTCEREEREGGERGERRGERGERRERERGVDGDAVKACFPASFPRKNKPIRHLNLLLALHQPPPFPSRPL